jgi:hypothetical protein
VERSFRQEPGDVKKTVAVALFAFGILATQPLFASHSAAMHVSVEVIARTILTIDSQPASVTVTADDVARGYVDLPSAIAFHVLSNARNGYTLDFQPVAAPFTSAQVSWGTATATFGSDGSWITQPYQQGTTFGTMNVRLSLAPGTAAGTYSWPVGIGADSL